MTVGGRLDGRVDLLDRGLATGLEGQVGGGARRHRHAQREAVELALELGQHQADGLRGTGRGRHDVERGGAGATRVLVDVVEQVLVGGVGVDRGHQALDDAELVVEHLGHRRQAVGRARRVGDHVVAGRVVQLVVDAHHDGDVVVGGRRGDDDLLGAGVDVRVRLGGVGEEAGGLDDHVGADLAPLEVAGVALGVRRDLLVTDVDGRVGRRHVGVEPTQDRVELEQVGQGLVVGEVVDPHDLDVGAGRTHGAEEVAADAAEAIDAYTNSHRALLNAGLSRSNLAKRVRGIDGRPAYVPVTRRSRVRPRRPASPGSATPRCRGCPGPRRACRPSRAAGGSGRRWRPW